MRALLHLTLAFILLVWSVSGTDLFVTSIQNCGASCQGDANEPFDNLLFALQAADLLQEPSTTIYLLSDPSMPHYILQRELTTVQNSYLYQLVTTLSFSLNNVIIKPLFCDDAPVLENPSLSTKCIGREDKLTVYLKSTTFTINVLQNVQIQNIVFDAVEDIITWNANSATLRSCIYTRSRCCEEKVLNSPTNPSLTCARSDDYNGLNLRPTTSLFVLNGPGGFNTLTRNLTFTNVDFKNFVSPQLKSLIQTGRRAFNVNIIRSAIDNIYFDKGFISHVENSTIITSNSSGITLTQVNFTNYNFWDLKNANREEGYLFYGNSTFSGVFQIDKSNFINMTTSTRSICLPQRNLYFNLPMDNRISTSPRSRTNIWNQYHQDHRTTVNKSSLIYIKSIYGAITLSDSSFRNIIGTSGSVLRVDDVVVAKGWMNILNSTFDNNFAYDGFTNIRIAKESDATFSSMQKCPSVEISDSQFSNSHGCPGSYGNVLVLCYWDSNPPTSQGLSNYSLPVQNIDLQTWLENEETPSYIRVKNSLFRNNSLSVSNSLAIVGSNLIILENNIFQNNGGTTGELYQDIMKESYFINRYPSQELSPLLHFGQSTAVLLDYMIRLNSKNNIYQENWSPYEGSVALATSLTIKSHIETKESIIFQNDTFRDHNGIPAQLTRFLTNYFYKQNMLIPSIISFATDQSATIALSLLSENQNDANIIMDKVKFYNNSAQYDYDAIDSSSRVLDVSRNLITDQMRTSPRFSTGFIKFLTSSEALDIYTINYTPDSYDSLQRNFIFRNGEITNNTLLNHKNGGCLFSTLLMTSYVIDNVKISGNNISDEIEATLPEDLFDLSDIKANQSHGIFCLYNEDSYSTFVSSVLQVSNLLAQDNSAIIFNLYPTTSARLTLTNSQFTNNKCYTSSVITIYAGGNIVSTNNQFTDNYNRLGNVFLTDGAFYQGNSNTYIRNNGVHASLIFSKNSGNQDSSEIGVKASENDISPSTKMFGDGLTPQGGLYFFDSCSFKISESLFVNNYAYSGIIMASRSTVTFTSNNVTDYNMIGSGVIGTILSMSTFNMEDTHVLNNILTASLSVKALQPAFITLVNSEFTITKLVVAGGNIKGDSIFLSTLNAEGSLTDVDIYNFSTSLDKPQALIKFSQSKVQLNNFKSNLTTSLISASRSELTLNEGSVENLLIESGSQFILQMSETKFTGQQIRYTGYQPNSDLEAVSSLVVAENSEVDITSSMFTEAISGQNKVFSLVNTEFSISNSTFEYTDANNDMTIFDIFSNNAVLIQGNLFESAGQILQAKDLQGSFSFIDNTISTNSHLKSIALQNSKDVNIMNNHILGDLNTPPASFPESQIQILNSMGLVKFQENIFDSLWGQNGAVEIRNQNGYPYNVEFSFNQFINNRGTNGGAIHLNAAKITPSNLNPKALIQNCIFLSNKALNWGGNPGKGGALYQTTPDETIQQTNLLNNQFINNTADTWGGAIFFDYSRPYIDSESVFTDNYATVLNHIGSYPVRLVSYNEANPTNITYVPGNVIPHDFWDNPSLKMENIASGLITRKRYVFALLDQFGQVVAGENNSTLEFYYENSGQSRQLDLESAISNIERTNLQSLYNGPQIKANNGLYVLQDFILNYKANEAAEMSLIATGFPTFDQVPGENFIIDNSITVDITFRGCSLGEFASIIEGTLICQECPFGYSQLSMTPNVPTCTPCDLKSTLCLGGNNVGPMPGFWRMDETADQILQCPRKESCIGNSIPNQDSYIQLNSTGICAENYQGNLCYNCHSGWARNDDKSCINCDNSYGYIIKFVVTLLVQIGLLILIIEGLSRVVDNYRAKQPIQAMRAILVRIAINYLQIISLIAATLVAGPKFLQTVLFIYSRLSSINEQFFFMDCFFNLVGRETGIKSVFLKALAAIISPIIFIIFGLSFWTLWFKFIKRRPIINSTVFANKVKIMSIVFYFVMFQTALKSALSLYDCKNLYREDDPEYYLALDYDVKCWTGAHLNWTIGLSIVTLFIWVLMLGFILVSFLRKIKTNLITETITPKHSYLSIGYKKEKYYWESIVIIRKILLILAVVLGGFESSNLQIFLVVLLLIIACIMQERAQPYLLHELNLLERVGLISSIILALCVLYFQLVESSKTANDFIGIVGLIATACFFLYLFFIFVTLKPTGNEGRQEQEQEEEKPDKKLAINESSHAAMPLKPIELTMSITAPFHHRRTGSFGSMFHRQGSIGSVSKPSLSRGNSSVMEDSISNEPNLRPEEQVPQFRAKTFANTKTTLSNQEPQIRDESELHPKRQGSIGSVSKPSLSRGNSSVIEQDSISNEPILKLEEQVPQFRAKTFVNNRPTVSNQEPQIHDESGMNPMLTEAQRFSVKSMGPSRSDISSKDSKKESEGGDSSFERSLGGREGSILDPHNISVKERKEPLDERIEQSVERVQLDPQSVKGSLRSQPGMEDNRLSMEEQTRSIPKPLRSTRVVGGPSKNYFTRDEEDFIGRESVERKFRTVNTKSESPLSDSQIDVVLESSNLFEPNWTIVQGTVSVQIKQNMMEIVERQDIKVEGEEVKVENNVEKDVSDSSIVQVATSVQAKQSMMEINQRQDTKIEGEEEEKEVKVDNNVEEGESESSIMQETMSVQVKQSTIEMDGRQDIKEEEEVKVDNNAEKEVSESSN